MAIEAKVSGTPQEVKRDYPYLGRHEDGTVVLFTGEEEGVCVVLSTFYNIGFWSDTWKEDSFTPLSTSETITLSNK